MSWVFLQAPATFSNDAALGTTPITLGGAVAAGDLVVGMNTWDDTGLTETVTVADNLSGNTYTVEAGTKTRDSTNTQSIVAWWSLIVGGGTPTITATHAGSRGFRRMCVAVYSGAAATPRDQTGANFQTGVAVTANAITCAAAAPTGLAGELVVVSCDDTGGATTYTAGTSPAAFTIRSQATSACIEDMVQAAAGALTGTVTQNVANQRIVSTLLTFMPAGGGNAPYRPPRMPLGA